MLHYYAPEVLQQLGIDLDAAKRDLAARILPNRFECQGPAIIRSQDLSDAQAAQACDVLIKRARFSPSGKYGIGTGRR